MLIRILAMQKRAAVLLFPVLLASTAAADTLANVKAAVAKLAATQPVRATYAGQDELKSAGKFDNNQSARNTSFEVAQDQSGVTVTISPALVAKAAAEGRTYGHETPAREAIRGVAALGIVDALDFHDRLLGLLSIGKVAEEKRAAWQGRNVRVLVLKLNEPERRGANEVRLGKSSREEDRLTLYLGDDDVPVAAERFMNTKGGFLIFRFESTSKTTYTFGRRADRLYLARI
ncbi:MAG TPA: hypothetical protein VF698_11190, partial [Thermoanaerobaculia bacterium]